MQNPRILIVGAGATGGAFGARLIEAGRDVTFLVRPARRDDLHANGLRFVAPDGDRTLPVHAVTASEIGDPYDLVIVAVKAPALPGLVSSLDAAIGEQTWILPFLNGMDHFRFLESRYPGRVLGGLVKIVATVGDLGEIVQMTPLSAMTVGAFNGSRVGSAVADALDVPGIDFRVDSDIETRLWEKWAFIAAAGAVTCLFRNDVGSILRGGGEDAIVSIIREAEAVAQASARPVSSSSHQQSVALLTETDSRFTSSLYRDLLNGDAAEAEHILGALVERARALAVPTPLIDIALISVRAHTAATGAAAAH